MVEIGAEAKGQAAHAETHENLCPFPGGASVPRPP